MVKKGEMIERNKNVFNFDDVDWMLCVRVAA